MAIIVTDNQFHLKTANSSYIICVNDGKFLTHAYWGSSLNENVDLKYLAHERITNRPAAFEIPMDSDCTSYLPDIPVEFSSVASGDYRNPMFFAQYENGSTVTEFVYDSYRIENGKPALEGLPSTYVDSDDEAKTLIIVLVDKLTGLKAELSYTVFENYNIITRNARYINGGNENISLLSVQSACMDFPHMNYRVMHLHGAWAKERMIEYIPVNHGSITVESKRGMSSHCENPFIALLERNADEYHGNVYGFSLVYSGNFAAVAEGSHYGTTRVTIGINPFNFNWNLAPGENFQTPEVVLSFSNEGVDGMSQNYHKIYRERLARKPHRDALRPLVINNWEGTGLDFDEQKILDIAKIGADAGLEMFVLDDGWFGNRNTTASSLGDWYVNKEKLPNGLDPLVKKINAMGLKFGLWVEPEMISPDSDLYRAHPDWCIHAEKRNRSQMRDQLVLDLGRADVLDHVIKTFCDLLASTNIEYIKWDCNRNITETANPMQCHKFILGVYKLLDVLTSKFPDVLFEGCSGGGGRFDPGMMYYMPQTWTSDQSNPLKRIEIQTGTSIVYPPISMTGHVGAGSIENCGRDFLSFSADVAMATSFGYELDMSKLDAQQRNEVAGQIEFYKKVRPTIQFGDFHRLESPFECDFTSWQFVSPDKSESVVFFYQSTIQLNGQRRQVRLRGLDPSKLYECDGRIYCGDELMQLGIVVETFSTPYASTRKVFTEIN